MAMQDHDRRWWSSKKKGGKISSISLPTAPSIAFLDEAPSHGGSIHFQAETNDAELTQQEKLSKAMLGMQMAGSTENQQKLQADVEMLMGVVTSISFENEQQLSKIRELEMKLEASLEERQKLREEVEMLRPQRCALPDLNSFEEGVPSPAMLQEAFRAMQTALLICAVKMGEQVKPYLGSIYSSHQKAFHYQLCDCFFHDFETSPIDGSQVDPQILNIQGPPNNRRLFEEFMNYKTEDESRLFTMQHTLFHTFFYSRLTMFINDQRYNTPFTSPGQRQSVLVKLLRNERSPLFEDFARLANKVWLLHKLAYAFKPTAQIVRVNEGSQFDPNCMEIWDGESAKSAPAKVAFMISPGLTLPNLVLKAQVQLKKNKA